MKNKVYDDFWVTNKPDLIELIKNIIPSIEDNFRCTDDYDDDTPGIQITIAIDDDCDDWVYQTGDNSYSGACYGKSYWGIGYIYRDSNPEEVADAIIEDLASVIDDWED